MDSNSFEVEVREISYRCEHLVMKDGQFATVIVIVDDEIRYYDRINLDRAPARNKFADTAGYPVKAADLLKVREPLLDCLDGSPKIGPDIHSLPDEAVVAAAKELLGAPDLLERVAAVIADLGYVTQDETRHLPKLVYLALTSRVLNRPVNLVITGPSSAG